LGGYSALASNRGVVHAGTASRLWRNVAHLRTIDSNASLSEDLSGAIAQSMEKEPGEEVRSVRVFGDCYRCNWWAPDKTAHAWFVGGGRIRKSRFVRVTKVADRLVVEDLSKG
jgi:hypothetical protein